LSPTNLHNLPNIKQHSRSL